jgi:hypothetical protein
MRCDRHALARRTAIPRWGDGRGAITLPPSRGGCSSPQHYICVAMSRMAAASLELLHLRIRICCLIAFTSLPLLRLTRLCLPPAVSQPGPQMFPPSQTARCNVPQHQPGQSAPLPFPQQCACIPSSRLRQVVFADSSVAGVCITAAFFMPIAWQSTSLQARKILTRSCPHRTLISPVSLVMATLHFPLKSFMPISSTPLATQPSPSPSRHVTLFRRRRVCSPSGQFQVRYPDIWACYMRFVWSHVPCI